MRPVFHVLVLCFGTDSKCLLKWSSSEYGKLGTRRRKVSVFYAVTAMGGTFRNDPICGCGIATTLYGLETAYIIREEKETSEL